eukprot:Sdes_comp20817_c0_seq2m17259
MSMTTRSLTEGGICRAYVMPNLVPPIVSVEHALQYQKKLSKINPSVEYLMTLYLHPDLTPKDIHQGKKAGIVGVKSYPRGVTTNSESGIEDYKFYYPIFQAMQDCDMVLNLHGEVPSDPRNNISVMNAENHFLAHLRTLHKDFPKLRIVLEHATTAEAVETVKTMGETVACTITIHHLHLIIDDWMGKNHNFCKPVAKTPADRQALRKVVMEGHPRFFLGSDSAPHSRNHKETDCAHAGIFTSPLLAQYVAHIFDKLGCLARIKDFTSTFGRRFYKMPDPHQTITLVKRPSKVPAFISYGINSDSPAHQVVPFLAGQTLDWSIE